jgi:hypothetical protein
MNKDKLKSIDLAIRLKAEFDRDNLDDRIGKAFICVYSYGRDGRAYSGSKWITEKSLQCRVYRVFLTDGDISENNWNKSHDNNSERFSIEILDTYYNPKTFKLENPLTKLS